MWALGFINPTHMMTQFVEESVYVGFLVADEIPAGLQYGCLKNMLVVSYLTVRDCPEGV
jgi:hypothetical protein